MTLCRGVAWSCGVAWSRGVARNRGVDWSCGVVQNRGEPWNRDVARNRGVAGVKGSLRIFCWAERRKDPGWQMWN